MCKVLYRVLLGGRGGGIYVLHREKFILPSRDTRRRGLFEERALLIDRDFKILSELLPLVVIELNVVWQWFEENILRNRHFCLSNFFVNEVRETGLGDNLWH